MDAVEHRVNLAREGGGDLIHACQQRRSDGELRLVTHAPTLAGKTTVSQLIRQLASGGVPATPVTSGFQRASGVSPEDPFSFEASDVSVGRMPTAR